MTDSRATTRLTKRPIRVLFVLNDGDGGATLSALELMESFSSSVVQSYIVCHPRGAKAIFARMRRASNGFASVFMPWWTVPWREPLLMRPLIWFKRMGQSGFRLLSTLRVCLKIKQWGIDVVHTNTSLQLEGAFAANLCGIPHIWHIRELLDPKGSFRFHLPLTWVRALFFGLSSQVIANSRATAQFIQSEVGVKSPLVLPNAIDVESYSDESARKRARYIRSAWPCPKGAVVVGMCAAVAVHLKRHDLFIDAATNISRRCPNAWFILCGHLPEDGSIGYTYYESLREKIEKEGLVDRFFFSGHLEDMGGVMNALDILVNPSPGESFGRVVIEAMAAGIPVVGANSGAIKEIIVDGETGFLVDPQDRNEMGLIIEKLVEEPSLRVRLGANGQKRARTNYSLQTLSLSTQDLYLSVIDGRPN